MQTSAAAPLRLLSPQGLLLLRPLQRLLATHQGLLLRAWCVATPLVSRTFCNGRCKPRAGSASPALPTQTAAAAPLRLLHQGSARTTLLLCSGTVF